MAYCSIEDIKSDFKGLKIEATGTAVTAAEATAIIDQVSAYIDARIGLRYSTPVDPATYPDAGAILKMIATFMAGERIKNIIEVKTGVNQLDADGKQIVDSIRAYKNDLKMIAEGQLLLKDVPLVSVAQGLSSFNSDECVSHVIDTTKQQW